MVIEKKRKIFWKFVGKVFLFLKGGICEGLLGLYGMIGVVLVFCDLRGIILGYSKCVEGVRCKFGRNLGFWRRCWVFELISFGVIIFYFYVKYYVWLILKCIFGYVWIFLKFVYFL